MWTDQGEGQKVTYYQAQSGDDEAHYIISKIQEEVKDKHRSYKNFAILYRTNAQSRTVEEALLSQTFLTKLLVVTSSTTEKKLRISWLI